jgi:hypothetical protein
MRKNLCRYVEFRNLVGMLCGNVAGSTSTRVLFPANSGKLLRLPFFLLFKWNDPKSRLIDNSLIEGVNFTPLVV